jgi:hypothetical protein
MMRPARAGISGALVGVAASNMAKNMATKALVDMNRAQALRATTALTWAFTVSRLSESNRRPIHYERPRGSNWARWLASIRLEGVALRDGISFWGAAGGTRSADPRPPTWTSSPVRTSRREITNIELQWCPDTAGGNTRRR